MMEEHRAIAESVISYIVQDDVDTLKLIVSTSGDNESWRRVFRYELNIEEMTDVGGLLQYDIVAPRLALWGTSNISGYHLAALRGVDDVLSLCVNRLDIGVNVRLESGVSVLQMACFGGQLDTVRMIIDEMKADVNTTDNYGWSALHYASVEGHFSVVELLIARSADVNARDKDGTSASFRAHSAGHEDIVCLLESVFGAADELLFIAEEEYEQSPPDVASVSNIEPLYAVVNKTRSDTSGSSQSSTSDSGADNIRRMISQQLSSILDDDDDDVIEEESAYQLPVRDDTERLSHGDSGKIGYNTLTRVVREELKRYREASVKKNRQVKPQEPSPSMEHGSTTVQHDDDSLHGIYEEIGKFGGPTSPKSDQVFSSVVEESHRSRSTSGDYEDIPEPNYPPPRVPSSTAVSSPPERGGSRGEGPPLPRRDGRRSQLGVNSPRLVRTLERIERSDAAMELCFTTLARDGLESRDDWKKLGRVLPVCAGSSDKIDRTLKTIEQRCSQQQQSAAVEPLRAWRKWRGEQASVEALTAALRQCGLTTDADMLERTVEQSSA